MMMMTAELIEQAQNVHAHLERIPAVFAQFQEQTLANKQGCTEILQLLLEYELQQHQQQNKK